MREEGLYEVLFAPLPHGVYLVVVGILSPNGTIIQGILLIFENRYIYLPPTVSPYPFLILFHVQL